MMQITWMRWIGASVLVVGAAVLFQNACGDGKKATPGGDGTECVVTEPNEATCDDTLDNDCDGLTDCDDANCGGLAGCPCIASESPNELTCGDSIDNDAMRASTALTWIAIPCPAARSVGSAQAPRVSAGGEATEVTCDDVTDNDCDGSVDCGTRIARLRSCVASRRRARRRARLRATMGSTMIATATRTAWMLPIARTRQRVA